MTLLTAGLPLRRFAPMVAESVDDLIVSLDGPAQVHDEIRGIPGAFLRLADGLAALRRLRPTIAMAARCTVQKKNFRCLRATVAAARGLGLNSVSFLAADVTSEAFNRPEGWSRQRQDTIALNVQEVEGLSEEVEGLIQACGGEIRTGFIVESAEKLRRIVLHFRSHRVQAAPVAPRCNAPWVSAVIEADGTVRPCFFHRPIGNLYRGDLQAIINGPEALAFRRTLDVPSNPICRNCVCPLYVPPLTPTD